MLGLLQVVGLAVWVVVLLGFGCVDGVVYWFVGFLWY